MNVIIFSICIKKKPMYAAKLYNCNADLYIFIKVCNIFHFYKILYTIIKKKIMYALISSTAMVL